MPAARAHGHSGAPQRGEAVGRVALVEELPPESRDLDIPVGDHLGDPGQGLVGRLHVVPPQRGRRPQQGNVGGAQHVIDLVGGVVAGEFRHLAAAPQGETDDADENHDRGK